VRHLKLRSSNSTALNGALNVGNRGLVEFIEVFKNETEYLHAMITATQEKVIPAIDIVVVEITDNLEPNNGDT
jgi:predicted Ser/Thr protein kinase